MSQIIRTLKIKSTQKLSSMSSHNDRKKEHENYFKNADPERSDLNVRLKGSDNTYNDIKNRMQANQRAIRKDNVRAIELLITASDGEAILNDSNKFQDYCTASVEYLEQKFGAENVVNAVIHNDETTPHMHVVVVPLVEKDQKLGLNAKFYTGSRQKLEALWTDFNENVGSKFGLSRNSERLDKKKAEYAKKGLRYKQTHKQLREFYQELPALKKEVTDEISILSEQQDQMNEHFRAQIAQSNDLSTKIESLRVLLQEQEKARQIASERLETANAKLQLIKNDESALQKNIDKLEKRAVVAEERFRKASDRCFEYDEAIVKLRKIYDHWKTEINGLKDFDELRQANAELDQRENELNTYEDELEEHIEERVSTLVARIDAYEEVMTPDQRSRSESILSRRLANRNDYSSSPSFR